MLRLFFALQPAPETAAQLLATAAPVLAELGAQPVFASNLHATLCFVGAVSPERLPRLRDAAARVHAAPVELRFDLLDYWERPRVLCACVSQTSVEATTLAQLLNAAALAADFAPDVKPLRAHLTLARKISPTKAAMQSWPLKISPGFVVRCDRFALMESRRGERGSIYSVVAEWPLYG